MIDEKLKNRALNPVCKGDPAPREKILKLGKKVTDVVMHKIKGITADDPEYWVWLPSSPTRWRTSRFPWMSVCPTPSPS